MSFNIGDLVAVTKLAYDVYSKGFLVARGAPDQFRELVRELSVFKDALYQIRSQTENFGELNYDDPLRSLIKGCLQILSDFGDFVGKYEQLGSINQSSSVNKKNDLITKLDKNRATKDIDPILAEEFKRGFDLVNEGQTVETWLRVAVWWLIKVILPCSINGLVLDLARSLHGDLLASRSRSSSSPPYKSDILLKYDVGLFESFEQPVEALENIPKAMDDPDSPYRWLTVDPGNGGRDSENIIYRT
ncbi:MAG: hypothetical protein Q9195_007890 [Heterodermia aff. obscurata]